MKKVAVIGGGITGLSSAFYLQEAAKKKQMSLDINVFEANGRLGGKVHTFYQDGLVIERGADSFLARKKPGMDLMEALGLENKLYRNETGQSYVLVNNQLHKIPAGSFMGIPVDEEAFKKSAVVSEEGKKRALAEASIPKGLEKSDQSLGEFLRGRFGDELVDHLLAPLLSGIYSSDIDEMSLMASFPNFYELEQKYGSVLKGLRETMPVNRTGTGKKPGQFVSVEGGLTSIIDALEKELGSIIRKKTEIIKVDKTGEKYILHDNSGNVYETDAVIIAIPHKKVPDLFGKEEETVFSSLSKIPVKSVANVVLAFNEKDIEHTMDGTGFVVSRTSDVRMTACTWTHEKWPATTPDGKALLRAYVGRPSDQEIVQQSDEEMIATVLADINKVMGLDAVPEFTAVTRWEDLMPQYTVGHPALIQDIEKAVSAAFPGIYLAGASYHGVGLPDCIGQAEQAQQAILAYLKK